MTIMHPPSQSKLECEETLQVAALQAVDFVHRQAQPLWKILEASELKSATDAVDNLVVKKQDVAVDVADVLEDLRMIREGLLSVRTEEAERLAMPDALGAITWFGARLSERISHIKRLCGQP
jgi:hypothetical protein